MKSAPSGSLRKALAPGSDCVVLAVEATDLVQQIMDRTGAMPPAMVHVGQAALSALLMQALSDSEDPEKLELQWSVDGLFGNLYADALDTGKVRATVQKGAAEAPSMHEGLGKGLLQVRRTRPDEAVLSTGIIESRGRVAEDLVEYLEKSEQRQCGLDVTVNIEWDDSRPQERPFRVTRAAGYLLYVLPHMREERFLENLRRWDVQMRVLGPVSKWALPHAPGASTQFMLDLLFSGMLKTGEAYRVVLDQPVELKCQCSQERAARALALLSPSERKFVEEPPAPDHPDEIVLHCEYCGASYRFPRAQG